MDQITEMAADILLGIGAIGAAIYCMILARRLKRFSTLENGVGGAVAVLSAQVDDMTRTLDAARKAAGDSSRSLSQLTERAEASARKLEIMMASLHDLPDEPSAQKADERDQDAAWDSTAQDRAVEATEPMFATRRAAAREAAE